MAEKAQSFVKTCQDAIGAGAGERKITFEEFKALTDEDKRQLRQWMIDEGYNVLPLATS